MVWVACGGVFEQVLNGEKFETFKTGLQTAPKLLHFAPKIGDGAKKIFNNLRVLYLLFSQ